MYIVQIFYIIKINDVFNNIKNQYIYKEKIIIYFVNVINVLKKFFITFYIIGPIIIMISNKIVHPLYGQIVYSKDR